MTVKNMLKKIRASVAAAYMVQNHDSGFSAEEIPKYLMILGFSTIIASMLVKVLIGMKAGETDADVNATIDLGVDAIQNITEWFDDIGTIFATAIIIGLLLVVWGAYNYYQGKQGGL